MEWFPRYGFTLYGGWCLSFFYLVIHFVIPVSKKGALPRLLVWPKKGKPIGVTIGFWTTQLSWWSTIIYPFFYPLKTDSYLFYTGVASYFIGMACTVSALWTYSRSSVDLPSIQGLYRLSRNPIYVAYILVGYGIGLSIRSWILIVLHTVEVVSCHFVILDEERYCIERYGSNYQRYLKNVPRYLWKI